ARAHRLTVRRREGDVLGAVIALLGAAHFAITAVRRQRAVFVAGAVRAAVHAVITILTRVFDAVAAAEVAVRVARIGGKPVARAVVTLLVRIQLTVAARSQRNVRAAISRARAGSAVVLAVIAL